MQPVNLRAFDVQMKLTLAKGRKVVYLMVNRIEPSGSLSESG